MVVRTTVEYALCMFWILFCERVKNYVLLFDVI